MKSLLVILLCVAAQLAQANVPKAVVLPERFAHSEIIVKNGPEYKALARSLEKQLSKEHETLTSFVKTVDTTLQRQDEELVRLRAENTKLKADRPHISIFGVFATVVQFVLNPFSFIVGKTINILLGLAVAAILCAVALHFYRKYRKRS